MKEATPASARRLKCGRYTSRSVRSSTRASTVIRVSSIELSAKCFAQPITLWACTTSTSATASSPSRYGSSPSVSWARPQEGWRSRLMQAPPQKLPPCARISFATTSATRRCSARSQLAPRAIAVGKQVECFSTTPRGPSEKAIGGIARRFCSPAVIG